MADYMAIICWKYFNTNYHELFINFMRQQDYMINYMAITCLNKETRIITNYSYNINDKFMGN